MDVFLSLCSAAHTNPTHACALAMQVQVAEQAVLAYSEALQDRQDQLDAWDADNDVIGGSSEDEEGVGGRGGRGGGRRGQPPKLPPPPPGPLVAASTCMGDLQWLWPGLDPGQQLRQLPLVVALGANALAFACQALEAEAEEQGQGAGVGPGSAAAQYAGLITRGPWSMQAGANGRGQHNGHHSTSPAAAAAKDCVVRSAAFLAFLFPLDRSSGKLVSDARLYRVSDWGGVAEQAAGALGALEMALRGGHAPTPASHILLLHATAGVVLAAPGSFWTHGPGRTGAVGCLVTLRKVGVGVAAALEANLAQAFDKAEAVASSQEKFYGAGGDSGVGLEGAGGLRASVAGGISGGGGGPAKPTAAQAAARAAAVAAAIDPALQQRADLMLRLLAVVVDALMARSAPVAAHTGSEYPEDELFSGSSSALPPLVGKPQGGRGGARGGAAAGEEAKPSPSIIVVIGPKETGQPAPVIKVKGQVFTKVAKRGLGEHNPEGMHPAPALPQRVSEASQSLRSLALAELLPAWLRLWGAQLRAAAPAVEAAAAAAAAATTAAPRLPGAGPRGAPPPALGAGVGGGGGEAARYALLRSGLEWVSKVAGDAVAVAGAVITAYQNAVGELASARQQQAAQGQGMNQGQVQGSSSGVSLKQLDPALLAVSKAAKEVGVALHALTADAMPLLTDLVIHERKRLDAMGVVEGQAVVLRTIAKALASLESAPGGGRAHFVRAALESGLASELASLYDAMRARGGRQAAAAACMDGLQVVSEAAAGVLGSRQGAQQMAASVKEVGSHGCGCLEPHCWKARVAPLQGMGA